MKNNFAKGMRDGIPIALGYFAVAFSLGMMARKIGLSPFQGFISSFMNHASAGEYAEFTVIGANSPLWEMALIIFITNARYMLMSFSYSQRFKPETSWIHRVLLSFGITDEIFGATISHANEVTPAYTYGLMAISIPFWATGTAIGIMVGNALPGQIVGALSVALYGMFLAIIVPPAKKDKVIAGAVVISFTLSYLATKIPGIKSLSESMRVIILTVVISSVVALLFPHKEEESN